MCRLFGMSGGPNRVAATFWLLEAPDSLAQQSRREPDGTGLGTFDELDRPVVAKQPLAAYEDKAFAREARAARSRTFVAHVRYASTGAVAASNTHPFEIDGRLFAHNGMIGGLPALEAELGDGMRNVHGETDSERFFALIAQRGLVSAAQWVADNLPVYALNVVLISATEMWALRYPATHELYVLECPGGAPHLRSGTVHVHAPDEPTVMVATERMTDDPGWRPLGSGELLHVDPDLHITVTKALPEPPAHPLTLGDLDPRAAASQHP